jgi:hypothetical protein
MTISANVFGETDPKNNIEWFPYWWLYSDNKSIELQKDVATIETIPLKVIIGHDLKERKRILEDRFKSVGEKLSDRLRAGGLIPQTATYLYCANSDAIYTLLLNKAEKLLRGLNPPEVILPHLGRIDSKFAIEIADTLPKHILFRKDDWIVTIFDDDAVAAEGLDENGLVRGGLKFNPMSAIAFTTWIEQFIITGKNIKVDPKRMCSALARKQCLMMRQREF